MSSSDSLIPAVRKHPEVLRILRRVAAGDISATDAFDALISIVTEYISPKFSQRQGLLIGGAMAQMLTRGESIIEDREWNFAGTKPSSELAAARCVWWLTSLLSLANLMDPEIRIGERILRIEKLELLFPPTVTPYADEWDF